MVSLSSIVAHLNRELKVAEVPDYADAFNGLQLANRTGQVSRAAAAVDSSLTTIRAAVAAGCDLLIVHHGLFWSCKPPITGPYFEKLRLAMEGNLAIYSAHIPLDVHPVLGNNALLAKALGLEEITPFLPWKGILSGMRGRCRLSREDLALRLELATGQKPHLAPGGPEVIEEVGVVTGGAGSEIADVAACGIDTFVTGEGPHWSYLLAEELGLNLFYGGHYATETFGVKALGAELERSFSLPWHFLNFPTGL